jgi:hypothetical protein
MKALDVVHRINEEYFNSLNETNDLFYISLNFNSDGFYEQIKYLGDIIWSSVEYFNEEETNEDLYTIIKKRIIGINKIIFNSIKE